MQITHEEALRLIHFRSDHGLDLEKQAKLQSHLDDCADCFKYADQIQKAEKLLQVVMNKHWNAQPLPQNRNVIKAKVKSVQWNAGNLVPTRSALISVTLILFGFVVWQFSLTSPTPSQTVLLQAPQIPTPATMLLTSTQNNLNDCKPSIYEVQENDTLDEIASHYSVSKDAIMELNDLTSESIFAGTRLQIPNCDLTPTGTSYAPTFTITPIWQPATNTPG